MDRLTWCFRKENGIKIVEPNENLRKAYLQKTKEAIETAQLAKSRDWKITCMYYSMYLSLYSILMKIGVKSTIHTCTIEFAKVFLKEYFLDEELALIEKGFVARIDSQYYTDKFISEEIYQMLLKQAPLIYAKASTVVITEDNINAIRRQLSHLLSENT